MGKRRRAVAHNYADMKRMAEEHAAIKEKKRQKRDEKRAKRGR